MIALAGFATGVFLVVAVIAGVHGSVVACIILSVATVVCAYKAIGETILNHRELKASRRL